MTLMQAIVFLHDVWDIPMGIFQPYRVACVFGGHFHPGFRLGGGGAPLKIYINVKMVLGINISNIFIWHQCLI